MIDPGNDEGRPRQGGPDVDKVLSVTDTLSVASTTSFAAPGQGRRKWWARVLIARGRSRGEVPCYGSRAWLDLPDGDARKVAGVVIAAECWAADGDDLVSRLHREVAQERAEHDAREAEVYANLARGVRSLANAPTIAELRRRRAGGPA